MKNKRGATDGSSKDNMGRPLAIAPGSASRSHGAELSVEGKNKMASRSHALKRRADAADESRKDAKRKSMSSGSDPARRRVDRGSGRSGPCSSVGNGVGRMKRKEKVLGEDENKMVLRSHSRKRRADAVDESKELVSIESDPENRRVDHGNGRNEASSSAGNGVGRMKGKEVVAERKHCMVLRSHVRKQGEDKVVWRSNTGKHWDRFLIGDKKERAKGKGKVAAEKKSTKALGSQVRKRRRQLMAADEKGAVKRKRGGTPANAAIAAKKPRADPRKRVLFFGSVTELGQSSVSDRFAEQFDCSICFETKQLRESFDLKSCSHMFCSSCISQYIAAKVDENVTSIRCPDPTCKDGILEPEMCKRVLPKRVFNRWGIALCESALGMKRFYCPFKECSALLVNEGSDQNGQPITNSECPHCHRMFCAQCRVPWHDGISCEGFQQLGEDERGKDDILLRKLATDCKWQRCPRCRMYVEKVEGCMFMQCRCGFCFCYVCASPMSRNIHYCAKCRR